MEELKMLFDEFNEKPIAYNRVYSKITGGVTTGLLLSQLVYWAKAMNYKEFYKTDNDFSEELGMGLYELRGAKKRLSELGLVKLERKGVPAKTYYQVNVDKIIHLITRLGKNHKLDCGNSTNKSEEIPQTITETNTETTQKKGTSNEVPTSSAGSPYQKEKRKEYTPPPEDTYKTKYDIARQRGQRLKKKKKSTAQEKNIEAMKLMDYFRDRAREIHGLGFLEDKTSNRSKKVQKLFKQNDDVDRKEMIDWWLGGEGEWAGYSPDALFAESQKEKFKNSKVKPKKKEYFDLRKLQKDY